MASNSHSEPNWLVDPIIHLEGSTSEEAVLCSPAIIGGKMGGNTWVLSLMFSGAHVGWLVDHTWHTLADCPKAPGNETLAEYRKRNP
jgi:hypothetical protein